MAYENARYLEIAQQACELERSRDWKQASEHWTRAAKHATHRRNATWSEARTQYCEARAGIRLQTILTLGN